MRNKIETINLDVHFPPDEEPFYFVFFFRENENMKSFACISHKSYERLEKALRKYEVSKSDILNRMISLWYRF